MKTSRAITQEDQRTGDVVRSRIRHSRIESRLTVQHFPLGQRNFPSEAEVQSELWSRLEIILGEERKQSGPVTGCRRVDALAALLCSTEDETRKGMSGIVRETGKG